MESIKRSFDLSNEALRQRAWQVTAKCIEKKT